MNRLRRPQGENGQTMVEFAVVAPLLLTLIVGIVELGLAYNQYLRVTDAVRAGARKAAVSRNLSDPAGACKAAVLAAADNLNKTDLQSNLSCSSPWTPGSDVTVFADYKYDIKLLGWVVWSGRMKSQMKERVE
jgi:Flp pilus assembly protein TadG